MYYNWENDGVILYNDTRLGKCENVMTWQKEGVNVSHTESESTFGRLPNKW